MTLSVIRYINSGEEYIHCGADGRIRDLWGRLTEAALKILPLQISLSSSDYYSYRTPYQIYEIGFTYAGHVGVSLYTYSLLSYLCRRISINDSIPSSKTTMPSIECVAKLAAKILQDYMKDYGVIQSNRAQAEIVIFGFCTQKNDFVAYHLYPQITETKDFKIYVENVDIKNKQYFAIGSGKSLLEEKVRNNNGVFLSQFTRQIIEEQESDSSVGGYYQRAVCHKNNFALYSESPSKDIEMKMLGRYGPVYSLETHYISLTSTLRCDYD